jgi:viroplasmin and RNaseH domain-containing protein
MVYYGKNSGVYESWEKSNEQVDGYKNNCYKGHKTNKEVEDRSANSARTEKINRVDNWTSTKFDYLYPVHCHYGVVVIMTSYIYVTYRRLS